jgi:hypothetical protein
MAPPATQPTTIPAIAPLLIPELEELEEPGLLVGVDVDVDVVRDEDVVTVTQAWEVSIRIIFPL